jgi:hypothetical protein
VVNFFLQTALCRAGEDDMACWPWFAWFSFDDALLRGDSYATCRAFRHANALYAVAGDEDGKPRAG